MTLTIHLSEAHDMPCQLCGWLDSRGGVELEDDTGTRKVFCRHCTLELVRLCLPDGRFTAPAPVPVALAS